MQKLSLLFLWEANIWRHWIANSTYWIVNYAHLNYCLLQINFGCYNALDRQLILWNMHLTCQSQFYASNRHNSMHRIEIFMHWIGIYLKNYESTPSSFKPMINQQKVHLLVNFIGHNLHQLNMCGIAPFQHFELSGTKWS